MLYSAEQEFSFKNQRQSEGFAYWTQLRPFHGACMELGVNLDIVHEDTSLDGYKVVIVPCHFVVNPELAERLEAFAAAKLIEVVDTIKPEPALVARYEERYRRFRKVYPACKALFKELV